MKQWISKIGAYLLKRTRMMFVSNKTFFGKYADNMIEVKKFIANRPIIALYFHSDAVKIQLELPKGEAAREVIDAIVLEQIRVQRREFRKEKKAILFYVEDHFITRMLGFKETQIHNLLSA